MSATGSAVSGATPSSAPALSKRKFLDSIASLDAAVRDPLAATADSLTKRRRTSAPHRTSTPALEAILARTTRASTPSKVPPPPSYLPTSLPALLDRLATYRLATFSPSKPPSLSALSCALHGWVHTPTSRERVQCVTCGQGVVILPPSAGDGAWSSPVGQRLRQEYERLVSSEGKGHAETCPWRLRPCARSLYRLPSGGLGVQSGGRRRLLEELSTSSREMDGAGLSAIEVALPPAAARALDVADGRQRLVRAVGTVQDAPAEDCEGATAQPSTTTLLLATFGWNVLASSSRPVTAAPLLARSASSSSLSSLQDPGSPILSCTYCTRRVLASAYLPSASAPSRVFDLIQQHQAFCPYVDAHVGQPPPAASGTDLPLKPGWRIRLEAVLQTSLAAPANEADQDREQTRVMNEENKHPSDSREILSYVRRLLGPKGTLKERVVLRSSDTASRSA